MKRKIRFATLLAIFVMTAASVFSVNASADVLRGDANGDGSIDLADSILINQYVIGYVGVSNLEPLDFDGDYIVCEVDAEKLRRFLTHLSY